MPTSPREFPQCLDCHRWLKTPAARRRGYGPVCWKRHAALEHLPPDDPRRLQALPTLPLFEVTDEAS